MKRRLVGLRDVANKGLNSGEPNYDAKTALAFIKQQAGRNAAKTNQR